MPPERVFSHKKEVQLQRRDPLTARPPLQVSPPKRFAFSPRISLCLLSLVERPLDPPSPPLSSLTDPEPSRFPAAPPPPTGGLSPLPAAVNPLPAPRAVVVLPSRDLRQLPAAATSGPRRRGRPNGRPPLRRGRGERPAVPRPSLRRGGGAAAGHRLAGRGARRRGG